MHIDFLASSKGSELDAAAPPIAALHHGAILVHGQARISENPLRESATVVQLFFVRSQPLHQLLPQGLPRWLRFFARQSCSQRVKEAMPVPGLTYHGRVHQQNIMTVVRFKLRRLIKMRPSIRVL